MTDKLLLLYRDCVLVKGSTKSVIMDISRKTYYDIPNSLYEFIQSSKGLSKEVILNSFKESPDIQVVHEYLEFLENNDLIFYSAHPEKFPALNTFWDEPFEINNVLIDIDKELSFAEALIIQLKSFPTSCVQIRIYDYDNLYDIEQLLNQIHNLNCLTIQLLLPSKPNSDATIEKWILRFPKLEYVLLFGSDSASSIQIGKGIFGFFHKIEQSIDNEMACGLIDKRNFTVNMKFYTESLKFNTCLNRKLSLDSRGNVKNCPSMKTSYGNIFKVKLADVLLNDSFKELWYVDKSKITECKVCEYRHMCTDCRAYISEPDNIMTKPLKCDYNPIQGRYGEKWNQDILKLKARNLYKFKN